MIHLGKLGCLGNMLKVQRGKTIIVFPRITFRESLLHLTHIFLYFSLFNGPIFIFNYALSLSEFLMCVVLCHPVQTQLWQERHKQNPGSKKFCVSLSSSSSSSYLVDVDLLNGAIKKSSIIY